MKLREEYVETATALLNDCHNIELLDLITKLLLKSKIS